MKRTDDFETRRAHLADLSDEALIERFWALTGELVSPLVELGRANTSPAIERSVLLRMGFSSLEAKAIADACAARGLLGHGAGNVVYRYAKARSLSVREAGLLLTNDADADAAAALFKGGAQA